MTKKKHFGIFVGVVWRHWEACFGSTFAFMLAVVQYLFLEFRDPTKLPIWVKDFPPYLWLSVGTLLLFWASYAAWKDERTELGKVTGQLDELTTPKLELSIDDIGVGDGDFVVYDRRMNSTAIIVAASLVNKGAPSIVEAWKIKVTSPSGQTLEVTPTPLAKSGKLQIGPGAPISLEDSLVEKAYGEPIIRGKRVRGLLIFVLPHSARANLFVEGTIVKLSCRDINNLVIERSRSFTGDTNRGSLAMMPGLHYVDPKQQ